MIKIPVLRNVDLSDALAHTGWAVKGVTYRAFVWDVEGQSDLLAHESPKLGTSLTSRGLCTGGYERKEKTKIQDHTRLYTKMKEIAVRL